MREGESRVIRTKYRVPGAVRARYIRKKIGQGWYEWCEQSADDPRYDVAQGTCDAEDVPTEIRQQCDSTPPNGAYACAWPFVAE